MVVVERLLSGNKAWGPAEKLGNIWPDERLLYFCNDNLIIV
jgi:hypothetical protein